MQGEQAAENTYGPVSDAVFVGLVGAFICWIANLGEPNFLVNFISCGTVGLITSFLIRWALIRTK
jgi:uncharacterized membrane protein YjjP (DUF1212 family)